MDIQQNTSTSIVDHRRVATHGITAIIALMIGAVLGRTPPAPTSDDGMIGIVSTAMDRGADYWQHQIGAPFHEPRIVIFDEREPSPCGEANSQTGPFYCEQNERIYLDLGFLRSVKGDLGRAYVIAHELGHHVQKTTGDLARFADDSVKLELEADCLAGAWMRDESAHGHLAAGELASAVDEATAVGDDRLAPGSSPETWTHGSSAMRTAALERGYGGQPCNP